MADRDPLAEITKYWNTRMTIKEALSGRSNMYQRGPGALYSSTREIRETKYSRGAE